MASVHTRTEARSKLLASGATKTEAKRLSHFFLKKEAHMASGVPKTEAKGVSNLKKKRSPYGLGWNVKPRQKGTLWLRFLTEAKSYDLLASPQYVSVPESVQNIKNNRCQRPFLHWCPYSSKGESVQRSQQRQRRFRVFFNPKFKSLSEGVIEIVEQCILDQRCIC